MEEKLLWCLKIKSGIRITNPSEEEFKGYYEKAIRNLNYIKERKIPEEWIPIVLYYSAYYSIYSILRLIGIKSENHTCSILIFQKILDWLGIKENISRMMLELKKDREDAQYYLIFRKPKLEYGEKILKIVEEVKEKALLKREKIKEKIKELIKIASEQEI